MENIPYSNQNYYQNQNPTQYIITKDIIYKESKRYLNFSIKVGIISSSIGFFLTLLLFLVYLDTGGSALEGFLTFTGTMVFLIMFFFFLNIKRNATSKTKAALRNNQFVIYTDIIGDKNEIKIRHHGRPLDDTILEPTGLTRVDFLYLYNTYKYFSVPFDVSKVQFDSTDMGDEFFVVYIIPTKRFAILPKKKYILDNSLMYAYVDTSILSNFSNRYQKKQAKVYTKASNSITNIDENGLFELYKKYDNNRKGLNILTGIFIFFFLFGLILLFVEPILTLLFGFIAVIGMAGVYIPIYNNDNRVRNNINTGNYFINACVVAEDVTYRNVINSDNFVYFRVNELSFDIKCLREDFYNTQIGNTIYVCIMYKKENTLEVFAVLNPMKHQISQSILSKLQ